MWNIKWQVATTLILLCVLGCYCRRVQGQDQQQSELFAPVPNDEPVNATPEQCRRLEQIRRLNTTLSLHLVRINLKAFTNKVLTVSIPGERVFKLLKTGGEVRDEQNLTWTGTLEGEERGSATLIVRHGEITGSINRKAG